MEGNNKDLKVIDINDIIKKLWDGKLLYFKVLPIVFVIACIFILGFPRYYSTNIKLAPELGGNSMTSTLGSLASSFGFDIDDLQTNDAITPLLYPDLMEDNGFIAGLFRIKVRSKDGTIETEYFDYLKKYNKTVLWVRPINLVKNYIKKLKNKDSLQSGDFDPYQLSRAEEDIAIIVRDNINIDFDKKTGVINIELKDQDPLICRIIGDSVKERLQDFITEYRTSKARNDYEYYSQLTEMARKEYDEALREYSILADANSRVALKSVQMKFEAMENDLDIKLSAYTTVNAQMVAAKARIQERTPAFTVIKGASVPVRPSSPKRIIFVALMLILAFAITSLYILNRK